MLANGGIPMLTPARAAEPRLAASAADMRSLPDDRRKNLAASSHSSSTTTNAPTTTATAATAVATTTTKVTPPPKGTNEPQQCHARAGSPPSGATTDTGVGGDASYPLTMALKKKHTTSSYHQMEDDDESTIAYSNSATKTAASVTPAVGLLAVASSPARVGEPAAAAAAASEKIPSARAVSPALQHEARENHLGNPQATAPAALVAAPPCTSSGSRTARADTAATVTTLEEEGQEDLASTPAAAAATSGTTNMTTARTDKTALKPLPGGGGGVTSGEPSVAAGAGAAAAATARPEAFTAVALASEDRCSKGKQRAVEISVGEDVQPMAHPDAAAAAAAATGRNVHDAGDEDGDVGPVGMDVDGGDEQREPVVHQGLAAAATVARPGEENVGPFSVGKPIAEAAESIIARKAQGYEEEGRRANGKRKERDSMGQADGIGARPGAEEGDDDNYEHDAMMAEKAIAVGREQANAVGGAAEAPFPSPTSVLKDPPMGEGWDEQGNDLSKIANDAIRREQCEAWVAKLRQEAAAIRAGDHPDVLRRSVLTVKASKRRLEMNERNAKRQRTTAERLYKMEMKSIQDAYETAVEQTRDRLMNEINEEIRRSKSRLEGFKEVENRMNTRHTRGNAKGSIEDPWLSQTTGSKTNGNSKRPLCAISLILEDDALVDDIDFLRFSGNDGSSGAARGAAGGAAGANAGGSSAGAAGGGSGSGAGGGYGGYDMSSGVSGRARRPPAWRREE